MAFVEARQTRHFVAGQREPPGQLEGIQGCIRDFFPRLFALLAVSSRCCASAVLAADRHPDRSVGEAVDRLQGPGTPDDRLEMIIHTSRILTTDQKIVQIEPGNRDILDMTTLSPNQIQITAKAMGVTQVTLWDENKTLYTISVLVVGDSRELAMVLRSAFPDCALKVTPVASAVMISGYVDKNEYIDQIIRIAEEYYPKVINGMTVSGVQQVLLHVKVMEVSRTKLRQLGFDWAKITGTNYVTSGPNGLLCRLQSGRACHASQPVPHGKSEHLCLQHRRRQHGFLRGVGCDAAGQPDEDHCRSRR